MGITSESLLRGLLVIAPWIISVVGVWFATNRSNPELPMLNKRNSILLIILGLILFLLGLILVDSGIFEEIIPGFRMLKTEYKILGILLMSYGYAGRKYRLVRVQ